jgi:hypothetical protein
VTGEQAPTCRGEPAPYPAPILFLLFLLFLVRRRVLLCPGQGKSLLLAQPELLTPPLPALLPPRVPFSPTIHTLLLSPLRRARECARPRRGRVGPRSIHTHRLRGSGKTLKRAGNPKTGRTRKEIKKFTHQLADEEHGECPQGRVITTPRPEVDGVPRPGSRVLPREGSRSSRDSANATGSASSRISKIWSRLSIRGTIRRWWSLARTHPAVSPQSAGFFNAARSESSRAWCEGGDTPWYQEAAFSLSTLPV